MTTSSTSCVCSMPPTRGSLPLLSIDNSGNDPRVGGIEHTHDVDDVVIVDTPPSVVKREQHPNQDDKKTEDEEIGEENESPLPPKRVSYDGYTYSLNQRRSRRCYYRCVVRELKALRDVPLQLCAPLNASLQSAAVSQCRWQRCTARQRCTHAQHRRR